MTTISSKEVRQIIKRDLADKLSDNLTIKLADGNYNAPSVADAQAIIKESSVDRFKWIKGRFDCDDFAFLLKADFVKNSYQSNDLDYSHAFGLLLARMVDGGGHSINWMVNDDYKLRLIEPQSDQIFLPTDPHGQKFSTIGFLLC